MTEILTTVLPVVMVCSLIQSVIGVGLLVFGTPMLLLMGVPFSSALLYLLPSSLLISCCQVVEGRREGEKFPSEAKLFLMYCMPCVVLGLLFVLVAEKGINMKLFVGILLLFSAAVRVVKPLHLALTKIIRIYTKSYLVIMGAIHGLSNMGGGLLTILANTLYSKKQTVRFTVASGYLFFATMQLMLVLIYHKNELRWFMGILPLVSLSIYFTLGSRAFKATTDAIYQYLMTVVIFLFGITLLVT